MRASVSVFFVCFNIVDLYQLNTWLTPQRIFSATSILQSKHIGSIYIHADALNDCCCCCLFSSRRMLEIKQTILLSIADFSNRIRTIRQRCTLIFIVSTSLAWNYAGVFTFCSVFSQDTQSTLHAHSHKLTNKPTACTCSQWLTSWVWKFKCLSHFSFSSLDCCCVCVCAVNCHRTVTYYTNISLESQKCFNTENLPTPMWFLCCVVLRVYSFLSSFLLFFPCVNTTSLFDKTTCESIKVDASCWMKRFFVLS